MDDAHGDSLWPPHGTIPAAVMTNKNNTLWAVNLEERIWVIPRFRLLKLHKIVRSLKLRMYKDDDLYYLCNKNKGTELFCIFVFTHTEYWLYSAVAQLNKLKI